jgi:hypothetical protein
MAALQFFRLLLRLAAAAVEIIWSFQTTLVIPGGLEVELQVQLVVPEQSVQVFNQVSLNQQVVRITETMAEAKADPRPAQAEEEEVALGQ